MFVLFLIISSFNKVLKLTISTPLEREQSCRLYLAIISKCRKIGIQLNNYTLEVSMDILVLDILSLSLEFYRCVALESEAMNSFQTRPINDAPSHPHDTSNYH